MSQADRIPPEVPDMPRRGYSYIRISSKKQEKGKGQKRQNEYAPKLCEREGWVLDQKVIVEIGSAYRGHNADVGKLAGFLERVQAGEIPVGSVLIIENLDRLSREEEDEAYDLFRAIIRSGIWIATGTPERIYNRETCKGIMGMLEPLLILQRAHEESAMKSKRSRDNWRLNKKAAREHGKPLSKSCPAWLQLVDAVYDPQGRLLSGRYEFKPGAKDTLLQICQWCLDGLGEQRTAERLSAEPGLYPPLGPSGKWSRTTVGELLCDVRLYGAHQPMTFAEVDRARTKGKRMAKVPDGEPIPGYYPEVLPKEEWDRLQFARKSRAGCAGRPGAEEANLFTGLLFRAVTRQRLQRKPTYSGPNVYHYLREEEPAIDPGRIEYQSIEDAILDALEDLDEFHLLPGQGQADPRQTRIGELLKRLPLMNDRIADLNEQIEDETTEREGARALGAVLARVAANREELLRELKALQEEVAAGGSEELRTVQGLIALHRDLPPGSPKRAACRLRLKSHLRSLVEAIWLHAVPIRKGSRLVHVQINLRAGGRRYLKVLQSKTVGQFEGENLRDVDLAQLGPSDDPAGKAPRKACPLLAG
jgi:DNA invertase Pin-like site-specific DNA recombinase